MATHELNYKREEGFKLRKPTYASLRGKVSWGAA